MVFSNITTPLLGLVDTWVIGHLGQAWFLGGRVGRCDPDQPHLLAARLLADVDHRPDGAGARRRRRSCPARYPAAGAGAGHCSRPDAAAVALPAVATADRPEWRLARGAALCGPIRGGADLERPSGALQSGDHGLAVGDAGCPQPHGDADPHQSGQYGARCPVCARARLAGAGCGGRLGHGGLLRAGSRHLAGTPSAAATGADGVAGWLAALAATCAHGAAARPQPRYLPALPLFAALLCLYDSARGTAGGMWLWPPMRCCSTF